MHLLLVSIIQLLKSLMFKTKGLRFEHSFNELEISDIDFNA